MTGWEVLYWAVIAAVALIIDGFAVGIVLAFIRAATRPSRASGPYKSRSHE